MRLQVIRAEPFLRIRNQKKLKRKKGWLATWQDGMTCLDDDNVSNAMT